MFKKSIPYLIISLLFLSFPNLHIYAANPVPKENEKLLQRLDSIISNHESLVKEKEIRIAGLKNTLTNAKTDTEKIGLTRQLYDEYLVFDSDSALYYATSTRKLATKVAPEDYDLLATWKLNEAFIYTVQGLFDTTKELLESIDSSKLSPEMKSMYFGSLSYLYSMRAVYINSNKKMWKEDITKANQYRDSIQALNLPSSPDWLWVPIATALDNQTDNIQSLDVADLKETVDKSAIASRQNAINAYWLARYY